VKELDSLTPLALALAHAAEHPFIFSNVTHEWRSFPPRSWSFLGNLLQNGPHLLENISVVNDSILRTLIFAALRTVHNPGSEIH
jgi:hypothetical protein